MGKEYVVDGVTYTKDHVLSRFPADRNGDFTVPEGVSAIGNGAFARCAGLETVTMPDSVERLEHSCFYNCTSLRLVRLGAGLRVIGDSAFSRCVSLSQVELPEGLEEILPCAFETCTSLREIRLPSSVRKISMLAFSGHTIVRCSPAQFRMLPRDAKMRTAQALLGELEELTEEYRAEVAKCVRNYRSDLLDHIIADDDSAALAGYYQFRKKPTLAELTEVIKKAADAGSGQVVAAALDLKNRLFSQKAITAWEDSQAEKTLGLQERSVAEWRRIFKYHIKDGGVVITKYKGNDPILIIPEKIGNTPVRTLELQWLLEQAFEEVFIPEGVEQLHAFRSFYGLHIPERMHLPASVNYIEHLPHQDGKPLILAPEGSFAHQYAIEKGLPFRPE